jgi:DNA-binding SARP family transcriptional activator
LPRKLILFILLHSLRDDKGVSDNSLYETFWFGKSIENARNNRSVNVIKLKSLLENLDSTSISKDSGYLKFYFDPARVHIDYFEYLQIIRQKSDLTREQIVELLSMIEKRSFLKNTSADWLDPFKSEISNDIIDALLKYIDRSDDDDAEFLLHLTNCIFLCDSVSEEALKIQCRLLIKQGKLSLAKNAYSRFIKEYKQLYDEAYELSFKQIIEDEEA